MSAKLKDFVVFLLNTIYLGILFAFFMYDYSEPVGFVGGFLDGTIALPSLIKSYPIYNIVNVGWQYNAGFLLGYSLFILILIQLWQRIQK